MEGDRRGQVHRTQHRHALLEHFLSRADWVDREHTVDRVIVGDPEGLIHIDWSDYWREEVDG